MKFNIINKIQRVAGLGLGLTLALPLAFTSCAEQENTLVEYAENNTLQSPNDTVYSLLGIISKMQVVADRTVLLGEIRGDLTTLTDHASLDLKQLADFEVSDSNPYNSVSDYYAIIQNCNYYIANVNTELTKHGEKVFEKELSVIKTYRAWTYLQLALNYGSVPFFTKPILTEKEADINLYPKYDVKQIADYFIQELAPLVDVKNPQYGSMNGLPSDKFYIPVRVLLGDLCLWAGRYEEAATYYSYYLSNRNAPHPIYTSSVKINAKELDLSAAETTIQIQDGYSNQFRNYSNSNLLTFIPMETEERNGVITYLDEVFNSVEDNKYYAQATYSDGLKELSGEQRYTVVVTDPVSLHQDTICLSDTIRFQNALYNGDLRLSTTYSFNSRIQQSENESKEGQTFEKCNTDFVPLFRIQHVYLRFAEALNRAGYPEAAFFILKYGICQDNIEKFMSAETRQKAGKYLDFSSIYFTKDNTTGIHSFGCGSANADKGYCIPELATLEDSVLYVEDKICDEMALETQGEGFRFYDLIRLSTHRGNPKFLAGKVANRNGSAKFDQALYDKLSNSKNWYLQLP